jgi:excisionase family DNA binding protein
MTRKRDEDLTPEVVEMVEKALVDRYEAARCLTVGQTAKLLGCSVTTVRRLIEAGDLPHVRVGARTNVMQSDALAYIASHRHGAAQAS